MLSSWLNGLLIFVPVGLWAFLSDKAPLVVFVTNGIAIVPLSSLLTGATEKIAEDAGDAVGAFLNITLGNLVELILFVALKHDRVRVVQASILGSILVNLLPILGVALFVNGFRYDGPVLNFVETQLLSCLLVVSTFVLLIPAALNSTLDESTGAGNARLQMSRASAIVVLLIYIFYIIHEVRVHTPPTPFVSAPQGESRDGASQIELEDIDTSNSDSTSDYETSDLLHGLHQRSNGEKALSVLLLTISSALMSMCAEFLVGTIEGITRQGHLSESFIGLVLLPIVGNVAEFVTVVTVAYREKLDLAVAVAVGSAVQIALCVMPLTIIASWIMARELTLSFSLFDTAALIGATVLVNFFFLGDASSVLRVSRLKGALMCACYIIIG
ncbi:Ca2+ transporter [Colletotrichum eremochloae]|nr:Ca2+ transporter [Colletotrichum eremochloae]